MRAAIYARVSTEGQQQRGTIGSQMQALRHRVSVEADELVAEFYRAKIAERYRRGKLFRSRAGEVLAWRTPYGYRRLPRDGRGPARLEIFEPEAAVVRRIFDDYVTGGHSIRQIARRLAADQI